ncbi:hypothetical protein [Saccharothrix sp. NRRL B-16314]|uniref:hypothetical protein n=1 Tax=Saccharothrix sp. NRRL B-16314 TaxID=1463825 RepID=UPI000A9A267D|nr:hypothetical protein [Saccharothrix sp. NRRL B-16314]
MAGPTNPHTRYTPPLRDALASVAAVMAARLGARLTAWTLTSQVDITEGGAHGVILQRRR